MRFARGDMRDHIVSHKSDYGTSYRRYGVLQRQSRLKISFCEIFGVGRFPTFATKSATFGLMHCGKSTLLDHFAGMRASSRRTHRSRCAA
jgi:hypothetical protein